MRTPRAAARAILPTLTLLVSAATAVPPSSASSGPTTRASTSAVVPVIRTVAGGYGQTLVVGADGTLRSAGSNSAGQLGMATGAGASDPAPTLAPVMRDIVQVAAGASYSLALRTDGTLYGFGDNAFGQLGTSTNLNTHAPNPTPTAALTGVAQIAAGANHSLVLETDGSLWTFGLDDMGQLGTDATTGTFEANPEPHRVLTGVAQIAAGSSHSLALRTDGTLWAFGDNTLGQLGTTAGTVLTAPTQVMTDVAQVAAGAYHSLALKTDGTLWSFGYNYEGQLGTTTNSGTVVATSTPTQVMSGVARIAAGGYHSLALKTDGTLWSFGWNSSGQLGTATNAGTGTPNPTPTQVMSGVALIAAGDSHSLAVTTDASLWTFGLNVFGQLGTTTNAGAPNANATPTEVASGVALVPPLQHTGTTPARLLDTRPGATTVDGTYAGVGRRDPGSVTQLKVAGRGGLPALTPSVVLDVTATGADTAGYVTVWPCDRPRPNASNLDLGPGATVADLTVTRVAADGTVCLYTSVAADLVADTSGSYGAVSSFVGVTPARVLDTRPGATTIDVRAAGGGLRRAGAVTTLPVRGRAGVPDDAVAVALTVTATATQGPGYVTAWPCDRPRPDASAIGYPDGATVANLVVVPLAADGTVCLTTLTPTHLVADITGFFAAGTDYRPSRPGRLVDTRPGTATVDGRDAGAGVRAAGSTTAFVVAGRAPTRPTDRAATLNLTVTDATAAGYITVWPCDRPRPDASDLGYAAGATVANLAITSLAANGTVCVYNSAATHLVIDLAGSATG